MAVLLEVVAASAASRWQRRQPRLLQVAVPKGLGLSIAAASVGKLTDDLDRELDRLEAGCRRMATAALATLRCWPASAGAVLELRCEGRVRRSWQFPPTPLSGGPWRSRRGRCAQPAQPAAHKQSETICLLTQNPARSGWAQAAAYELDLGGVVTVATMQQALRWLTTHPAGRLLLLDCSREFWCIDLSGTYAPERLPWSSVATLTTAMRKIFHHISELRAESDKIAA